MKFRCERDSLVEVLATAGRAVGTRSSAQMVLSGATDRVGREPSVGGRHRPRPDGARVDRGHRDHRRRLCRPGETAGRHRPVARARGGHDRVRGGEGRDRRGAVPIQPPDVPGGRLPVASRTARTGHVPAGLRPGQRAAPGGAGRVGRRRPPAADRCPDRSRGNWGPPGGDRLVPTGPAGHRRQRRLLGHVADPGAGPGAGRTAAAVGARIGAKGGPTGRRRTRTAPAGRRSACRSATTT